MFGKRLRELRECRNMSMDTLVDLYNKRYSAKMNKSTLSRYENEVQDPLYTVVVNLADFFGVSVDFISGYSETPFLPTADDDITFDDFTYAMYNETKELTEEDKDALLNMARILKKKIYENKK